MGHIPLLVDQLQERHITMVWKAMLRRLGDPELAEDATQEVFFHVAKSYGRFDPERGSFEGWLYGFVENIAPRMRQRHAALPEPRDDLADLVAEDALPPTLTPAMRDAINALPLRDRKLLILSVIEEWPAVVVGDLLGMSATNVTTSKARICARIAKGLELPDAA